MRKELGKPTRASFARRLRSLAPDFDPAPDYAHDGVVWPFIRRREALVQCVWYQQHKYEDSFTVELSWSRRFLDPAEVPFGSPGDPFRPEGCRFRLGAFWAPIGDHWWPVADGPPDILTMPPEEYLRALENPPPVDLDAQMPAISRAVDDAVGRIEEFALPYFDRVTEWAAG
jgi:hypothetical protein